MAVTTHYAVPDCNYGTLVGLMDYIQCLTSISDVF